MSPIWMFGTYHDPGHMPERYGIPDDISHDYLVQMADPVLPKRLRKRLQSRLRKRRHRPESTLRECRGSR